MVVVLVVGDSHSVTETSKEFVEVSSLTRLIGLSSCDVTGHQRNARVIFTVGGEVVAAVLLLLSRALVRPE